MTDTQLKLGTAARHLQNNQPVECQRICNELLGENPGLIAAFNLRGLASVQKGEHESAIRDLARVWPTQVQNTQAALWLGRLHRMQGQFEQALVPLRAASKEPALEVDARYELARTLTRLRQSSGAMSEYQRVLELRPDHSDAAANLAFLLERANRLEDSGRYVDLALSTAPQNFMALLTKATLERRSGQFEAARSRLEQLLQLRLSPMNQSVAMNQLAQCLLAQNDYSQAFIRYEQSNQLLRHHHPLGTPVHEGSYGLETISRLKSWLANNPPARWSEAAKDTNSDQPVFLVGFPRSGTTLLDQALSAHPEIEVLEEYEFLDEIRHNWVDGDRLQHLSQMNPDELESSRQQYLDAVAARRQHPGRRLFVDKLPLNLVYLFLIHRLFPRARILFMLRDPRDACLSCFFQSFDLQGAMPYFLDLEETAAYYHAVMELAQQSLELVGNPVLVQKYEELVTDFEPSMRSILNFLEVEWHPEVMDYRQKALLRIIDTPSYQQVTQPLYRDAMGRWRNFSDQMEPVHQLLGQWVEQFDYPNV
jgi:tetratricopeptide (TPR) repeat protein